MGERTSIGFERYCSITKLRPEAVRTKLLNLPGALADYHVDCAVYGNDTGNDPVTMLYLTTPRFPQETTILIECHVEPQQYSVHLIQQETFEATKARNVDVVEAFNTAIEVAQEHYHQPQGVLNKVGQLINRVSTP